MSDGFRPLFCAVLVISISATMLALRLLLPQPLTTTFPVMIAMTALLLLLLALALLCASLPQALSSLRTAALALAGLVMLISAWQFAGFIFDLPGVFQQLLAALLPEDVISRFATKTAPQSSAALFLMGSALCLNHFGFRYHFELGLAGLAATFALLWTALFGYISGAIPLLIDSGSNQSIGVAPPTLLCLSLLLVGITSLRPEFDLLWNTLKSKGADGLMARVLLPVGLLIPLVLAWIMPYTLAADGMPSASNPSYVLLASIGVLLTFMVGYLGVQLRRHEQVINLLHAERLRMQAQSAADLARLEELKQVLITVCAWTSRIKQDDKWVSIAEFLFDRFGIQVSHGISPDALDAQRKKLFGDRNDPHTEPDIAGPAISVKSRSTS